MLARGDTAETVVLSPLIIRLIPFDTRTISLYEAEKPFKVSASYRTRGPHYPNNYAEIGFIFHITEHRLQEIKNLEVSWKTNGGFEYFRIYKLTPERLFNRLRYYLEDSKEIEARVLNSIDISYLIPDRDFGDYWTNRVIWEDGNQPPFSNFSNSYGLFFSVSQGISKGYNLDSRSLDSLAHSPKWEDLKFVHY